MGRQAVWMGICVAGVVAVVEKVGMASSGGRGEEVRLAVFLALELEHGRAQLRGIARHFRDRAEVTVLKFARTGGYRKAELAALRPDGIIARAATRRDAEVLASLGVPVVNVSGRIRTPRLPTVDTDDRAVGEMAARHLAARGARRFAYVGSPEHRGSRLRAEGFEARLAQVAPGAAYEEVGVTDGDQTDPYADRVRDRLERWLASRRGRLAVFAFTDRLAVEVAEAARRLGKSVPEEVEILGVGNDATRLECSPVPLSSIELDAEEVGRRAAALLEARLAPGVGAGRAELVLVPPKKLVARLSTERSAVADEAVAVALDHIRENVANPVYVEQVARAAGVSRRALELRFRRALGTTVNREVLRLKLEAASELLADRALTLAEVADRTGFGSAKDLARRYKAWAGRAPREGVRGGGGEVRRRP